MDQQKDLLSIGAFANMTRLSIKALRLYNQLGLLQPRYVDPQTSYRYYGVDQLAGARMIRNMREMEMPLATIRQVLAALPTSPALAEALLREYAEMREWQVQQIRVQVQQFIQQIQQEQNPMTLEVNIKTIAPQQVLSVTHHVKVNELDDIIRSSVETMNNLLKEQKVEAAAPPFGIFHGVINEQEDGPIEICLPVNGHVQGKGDMQRKQLEGGDAACVMMVGAQTDFPAILSAYDAAADWINQNGHEMAESPREVWHSMPGQNPRMEIVWLFK